jgi:hypothetical protein
VLEEILKKTSRCRGDTGSDPETSKGRGEPFERIIVFEIILKIIELFQLVNN